MNGNQYELGRWDLSDLLTSTAGPELDKALADFEARVAALEAWRDRLAPDMSEADFLAAWQDFEALQREDHRLNYFGHLWFAEDTQSQAALSFKGKIENLSVQARNRTLFFTHWWKMLDDKPAARLQAAAAQATDIGYFLESPQAR